MADRMRLAGYAVVFAFDPKNEFFCIHHKETIITNNGVKQIRDIDSSKDKVLGYNFNKNTKKWCNFKKVIDRRDHVFEVRFDDGRKIRCTKNHRFFNKNREEVMLKNLKIGEEILSE